MYKWKLTDQRAGLSLAAVTLRLVKIIWISRLVELKNFSAGVACAAVQNSVPDDIGSDV